MADVSKAGSPRSVGPSDGFPGRLSDLLRNVVSLLSAGAGAIHVAVVQSHFEEYRPFGVFFAVLAWLQILWAIAVVARPSRVLPWTGVLISGIAITVWVVSRTVGLPIGPEAGSPEDITFIDLLATVFEGLVVIGAVALVSARSTSRPMARGIVLTTTLAVALAVALLTSASIVSFSPHEGPASEHERPGHTPSTSHSS